MVPGYPLFLVSRSNHEFPWAKGRAAWQEPGRLFLFGCLLGLGYAWFFSLQTSRTLQDILKGQVMFWFHGATKYSSLKVISKARLQVQWVRPSD